MNTAQKAFAELFPEKSAEEHEFSVRYNGKLRPYNANVKYSKDKKKLDFKMSRSWKQVSEDIRIGLIQELLVKIFREKKKTTSMDLYTLFLRNVHISIGKEKTEPRLEESFNRVNEKYYYGLIERPNLVWGSLSLRKLGHYEYGTDTISMSRIFEKSDDDVLDYVMYHELLHKKHKFHSKNGRSFHHTHNFRQDEGAFENAGEMERKISRMARGARMKGGFKLRF